MRFLKSGEFAELCGTTKNTLIHYDQMGLLKPARVAESGYRLYLASQRYRFLSVRVLADSGMPLQEVKRVLKTDDARALATSLDATRGEIEARIASLRESLERIDEVARQARAACEIDASSIGVIRRPARRIAMLGVAAVGLGAYSDDLVVRRDLEVAALLAEAGPMAELAPYGGVCREAPTPDRDVAYDDLFYVLPDDSAYSGATVELEAGEYVVASYDGPCSGLGRAHASLVVFARGQGLRGDLPRCEISALKLLDQEDRYRCSIEMRALGI